MTDQCTIGPDSKLLPTSKIEFIYDPDDPRPMLAEDNPELPTASVPLPGRSRGPARLSRKTQDVIQQLKLDEYGNQVKRFYRSSTSSSTASKPRTTKNKTTSTLPTLEPAHQEDSEASNDDFVPDVSQSESSAEDSDTEPTNEEIAAMLLSKIMPTETQKACQK
ncbi:hypothetical protein BDN71DRAFT_1508196 [Pleurotus eryngii]|uniref:Uncharacterized protein n=1 Tax=Pleurotus eryngii TaxID=5323 RepID=A0A9P6D5T9_PLEER|nr:hypothetical protein BDN71DRAFT_1508196 [Pleurotus eryngii]